MPRTAGISPSKLLPVTSTQQALWSPLYHQETQAPRWESRARLRWLGDGRGDLSTPGPQLWVPAPSHPSLPHTEAWCQLFPGFHPDVQPQLGNRLPSLPPPVLKGQNQRHGPQVGIRRTRAVDRSCRAFGRTAQRLSWAERRGLGTAFQPLRFAQAG